MPRSYSLKRAEIALVIKEGRIFHSPFFTARFYQKPQISAVKIAFTVSKKVFPTAVLRNKAKRRAREAFGKIKSQIKPAFYVFFLKKRGFRFKYR